MARTTRRRPGARPHRRPAGAVLAGLVVLLLSAGCVGPPPSPPGATPAEGAGTGGAPAAASPADSALQLEALLGRHTLIAADMMRGRLRADEDFAQAANAAVGQSTEELAATVGALGGAPQAARFRELWTDQVTALFTYSRSLATDDSAVRDEARTALVDSGSGLAALFAEASGGRLDPEAVGAAFTTHVGHLTGQADAYTSGDYPASNVDLRAGHAQSVELGHLLATNLVPPDRVADLSAPEFQLRSALTRLLGEHVGLALTTLRAGATGADDFPAAADALNANTTDVTAAVGSLFGEPGAAQFLELWADHLDLLGTYAADVGAGRADRRSAVQDDLRDWQLRFATFIETATGNRVAAPDLAAALLDLDDLLLQVDAFAAGDFAGAQELAGRTYPQVFAIARDMADAFGATVAARAPQGGAQTGAGGSDVLAPAGTGQPPDQPFRSVRTYREVAEPVRLRIPAVGIDTPLPHLGRAADGTVEVPVDFDVAGWFAEGPRPGEAGPAVVLGHVDSRNGPAVFHPLAGLDPGVEVLVDRADGSTVAFRVTGVLTVPKAGFPTALVYAPTLRPALHLVTCGGPFDHAAGSYRDNVIVSAEPLA